MPVERIIYCHCAYADIIDDAVKNEVLRRLASSGVSFEVVADLCELSARKDPALADLAAKGPVKIAACFPRAVRWLFEAAGSPLPAEGVEIRNMRTESAGEVAAALLGEAGVPPASGSNDDAPVAEIVKKAARETSRFDAEGWTPWFPVIDRDRCTDCMQCLSFCLFDVFGVDAESRLQVLNPRKCKTSCPACARLCPEMAIVFPKYSAAPLNGADVGPAESPAEVPKVDISALLGGNVYETLRKRSQGTGKRFSKERDEDKALQERMRCLADLQERLDIPPEVLGALPTPEQIRARAEAARNVAQEALRRRQTDEEKPAE